jgi:hypothetical protein
MGIGIDIFSNCGYRDGDCNILLIPYPLSSLLKHMSLGQTLSLEGMYRLTPII